MADPRVTEARLVVDPATYRVGPDHPTANLPGYEALDFFAPAGSEVVAPEAGTVYTTGFADYTDPHGAFGWKLHFHGVSGRDYFITHLGTLDAVPQSGTSINVRGGEDLGTLAAWPGGVQTPHVHWGTTDPIPEHALSTDYFAALLRPVTNATGTMALSLPCIEGPGYEECVRAQGAVSPTSAPSTTTPSNSQPGSEASCRAAARKALLAEGKSGTDLENAINDLCSGGGVSTAIDAIPGVGTAVDAITAVPKALAFIFSIRFLEIVGGGLLILLGISLLGKQLGVNVPAVPGV